MPDQEETAAAGAEADTEPRAERRLSKQPYSGEERRQAA
jgi:hypothetical protein